MILGSIKFVLLFIFVEATYTFVPEVLTVPTVSLGFGNEGELKCSYNSMVYSISWSHESVTSPTELLVTLDEYYLVGKRSGPGYNKGRFNITDDYSLVIHDVTVGDEGRYTCEIFDFTTGLVFRNYIDVVVTVIAEQPFVRIGQCEYEPSSDGENTPCLLHIEPDQHTFELSCTVVGAKPLVKLSWILPDQCEQEMCRSSYKTWIRSDRAFDQMLTVNINTSHFNNQYFTCVAEGLAVSGIANRTVGVFVNKYDIYKINTVRTATLSVVATLGFTLILIVVLWKRDSWWKGSSSRIEKKRCDIIQDITRQNLKPLYFGVFGEKGVGKSTIIDSLVYAFKGGNQPETLEKSPCDETVWGRIIQRPSEFIALCEIRDMGDVDLRKLKKLLEPMSTDERDLCKSDKIHYPIIVYDIGKHKRDGSYERSLAIFSKAVKRFMSEYPILVLTHITTSHIPDQESIIYRLSRVTHIPVDNIFFIGTNKGDDKKKEDETLQLLEILLKCVKNVTGDTPQRQTEYRKKSSKKAREAWKRLLLFREAMPSSEILPDMQELTFWKDVSMKYARLGQQMERESLLGSFPELDLSPTAVRRTERESRREASVLNALHFPTTPMSFAIARPVARRSNLSYSTWNGHDRLPYADWS